MSTIEHAVLKGTIGGIVEIRNIFTAEVTEIGGDTSETLWDTYMTQLVDSVAENLSSITYFYSYEVYQLNAGQWELLDVVTLDKAGVAGGEALLNAASVVLIGKAAGIRHMGRKFFGGLSEIAVSGNSVIPAVAVALAETLLYYISPVAGLGAGTLVPGTVDKNGGFWPFVGGSISSLLGTMRRRKPGNGI